MLYLNHLITVTVVSALVCDEFCFFVGTPVLALTGTADKETERTVMDDLTMKDPIQLFVSPNRCNLRFSVNKVAQTDMLKQLDWLVELIKENCKDTPKTIVFCDTMYSIVSVFNNLMGKPREKAFDPSTVEETDPLPHWHIPVPFT